MKSWDCWDTLIARRTIVDVHDEKLNVFPISENVSKVQPDDILVSDYYDEALLRALLPEVTGLRNRLIVSASGKASGTVWPSLLQLGVTEHIGDNPYSDVEVPRKHGLTATLSEVSKFTPDEQRIDAAGLNGLARSMREARLTTASSTLRPLELLQTQVNYPLLFMSSIMLHRSHGTVRRLLMSSRDCCLWKHAQEFVRDICGANYEIVYFKTSRICRAFPSESYLEYVNSSLPGAVVDVAGTGWSLCRLLQRSRYPDTQIVFITRYATPRLRQEYESIGKTSDRENIHVLLADPIPPSDDIEMMNAAPHAMYMDPQQVWNPANIAWEQIPEINVMHGAFMAGIKTAAHYDFASDVEVPDSTLSRQVFSCFENIKSYSSHLESIRTLLCSEDGAVMARLRTMSGLKIEERAEGC